MVFGESHDLIRTHFQKEADKIRTMKANWGLFTRRGTKKRYQTEKLLFFRSRMIAQTDFDFIVTYEQAEGEAERSTVLAAFKERAVYAFVHLISQVFRHHDIFPEHIFQITKDDYVRYTLTIIDDMLREDVSRTKLFEDVADLLKRTPFSFLLGLLHRQDSYIVHVTFAILTKMAVFGEARMTGDELDYFMGSLKEAINRGTSNDYIATTVRCMQTLFRIDSYRFAYCSWFPIIFGFQAVICQYQRLRLPNSRFVFDSKVWIPDPIPDHLLHVVADIQCARLRSRSVRKPRSNHFWSFGKLPEGEGHQNRSGDFKKSAAVKY